MSAIDSKLYALLATLVPTGEVLVFANQNSPRPALPYWTLRTQGLKAVGQDETGQEVDVAGQLKVWGVRELTCTLQRIGTGADNAVADVRDLLSTVSVREAWMTEEVALFDAMDVQNVPFPMDDNHLEPRALFDFRVRFGTRLLDTVGIIETVNVAADYAVEGVTPDPDLADVIVVVL